MTETKEGIGKKEKEKREERSHYSSVGRKKIAHDIRITRHDSLPSKVIQAIGINRPRKVWRVNELADSRPPLLQFFTLKSMTNKVKERKGREKEEIKHLLELRAKA